MRNLLIAGAVILTGGTFYSALWHKSEAIEDDITKRVTDRIVAENTQGQDIGIDVDGRHVTLSGVVYEQAQKDGLLDVADDTYGALGPIDGLVLQGDGGYVTAVKSDDGIALRGTVPNDDVRADLIAAAEAATDGTVTDELTLAGPEAAWQDEAGFGLGQMAALTSGTLTASAGVLALSGTTDDDPATVNNAVTERGGWQSFVAAPDMSAALGDDVQRLTTEISVRDARIAELEGDLDTANTDLAALTGERDGLQVELDALRGSLSDGEANTAELQAGLAAAQGTIAEKDAQIATLDGQIADLNARVGDAQAEIDALTGTVAERDGTILDLQGDLATLGGVDEQVASLRADLSDRDATIAALQSDLDGLSGADDRVAALQADLADRDAQVATLSSDLEAARGDVDRLTGVIEASEGSVADRAAQIAALTASLDANGAEVAALQGEVADLTGLVQDRDATIADLTGTLEAKDASIATLEAEMEDLSGTTAALEAEVASLTSDVDGLTDTVAQRDATIASLQAQNGGTPATATAAQCAEQASLALEGSRINFATGTATIEDGSVPLLERLTGIALACVGEGLIVEVGGHTDSRGSDEANQVLSEARAQAVADFMVARGVPANGLSAVGYGEAQPIADNETDEGRAANRRISFDWQAQ